MLKVDVEKANYSCLLQGTQIDTKHPVGAEL
jgi:hypothetical protein